MFRLRRWQARLWSFAGAVALVFLLPAPGSAQPRHDADDYYTSSWQRLQNLSIRLETLANQTRDEARVDRRHHGNEEYAERLDDFAKDAHEFRELMNQRNVRASNVNDRIRKLQDDARKVQQESAKSDRHAPRTDTDWNRTVAVLNEINNEYLAANGLAGPVATSGDRDRDRYDRDRDRHRSWTDDRRSMVNDLDQRADDAARLSESANLEIAPEIDRLRDQVRSFRQGVDQFSPPDASARIARMLAGARDAQADLAGSNAPAVRDDINAMVRTLVAMQDAVAAEAPAGTSGYGSSPTATDRGESMDVVNMARDLDAEAARANELAVQSSYYSDVGNDIAHFRDRTRDFEDRAADLSRRERLDIVDGLLRDAQKTQRDLARRYVSGDLKDQWNSIVNLLVRMRDRQ